MTAPSFVKSWFRSVSKNLVHTLINVSGLALGITCTLLIFLIIRFELSFDKHHPDRDRIYRVVQEYKDAGDSYFGASMTYPLPPALRKDFADPEYVTIVDSNYYPAVITVKRDGGPPVKFKEPVFTFADPEYFRIFNYHWIAGNEQALVTEKSVVLTKAVAEKYFGEADAMGKIIRYNDEFDVTVTGVVDNPPTNSDLPFQLIFSNRLGADKKGWEDWDSQSSSINCFVKLHRDVNPEAFNEKLKGWHLQYYEAEDLDAGKARRYFLQPLAEMHFDSRFGNFSGRKVSYLMLFTLGSIGVLLLITACINFINLNTVLIITRAREAGIRKVMGSTRGQLVLQFLTETFLITLLALLISAGLAELASIHLLPLVGYQLEFSPLSDPGTMLVVCLLPIVVTILSGLYPGIRLSRFQPARAFRNDLSGNMGKGISLRRILIVFQLVVSQALIISTIIISRQMDHFMSQPMGLNPDAILEFALPENKPELIRALRERIMTIPGVENVSMSNTGATSSNQWNGDFQATVDGNPFKGDAAVKFADHNFVSTYGLTLMHGENLSDADTATRFLVNESFTRKLGFSNPEEAIGIPMDIWGNKAMIRGVVKDFNVSSLHVPIDPLIITQGTTAYFTGAVKINTQQAGTAIKKIQEVWEAVYPKYVYEYKFLDDTVAAYYDAERKSAYTIGVFAGIAILIGCIGLFGLISFMAASRTKEVGIRKTLGATAGQVVALFSKEFVVLILISFALAAPTVYFLMQKWLANFAYHITPNPGMFGAGVAFSFAIVMITIGIKSYRAAVANPVEALRHE